MTQHPLAKTCLAGLIALCAANAATAQTSRDAIFALLCSRTFHYYDDRGNQIEYTAGDGSAYLWYHDRPDVVVGTWALFDTEDGGIEVCYQYTPGSWPDYVDGLFCFDETELSDGLIQGGIVNGDRYGLADGEPPFLMTVHPIVPLERFTEEEFPEQPPEPACGIPLS